ncbi:MAG: FxsA family protein [Hyphomicrobiales bacterium]|nr:FxsA family protein [Hyphomicrobiales bacterium]
MGVIILFFMIAVPIAEIALFIEVGGRIGVWPTVATVIVTAMIGTALLRHQGFATLARAQESLARNRFPVHELFDGLCLFAAGALLLTPGFLTDAVGFLLFVPPVRALLGRWLMAWMAASGRVQMHGFPPGPGPGTAGGPGSGPGGVVIDGEFHEVEEPVNGDAGGGNGPPRLDAEDPPPRP